MLENQLDVIPGSFDAGNLNPHHGQAYLDAVDAETFETMRETLFKSAFSVLHSELEAHRAVRRTLVKWIYADRQDIADPARWLYEKCLRQALEIFMSMQQNACTVADPLADGREESSPGVVNWLSRIMKALMADVASGFAVCGAVLHPAVIFQAVPFETTPEETLCQPASAKKQIESD